MPISPHAPVLFSDGSPDFHVGFVTRVFDEGTVVRRTDSLGETLRLDNTPVSLPNYRVAALDDLPLGLEEGCIVLWTGSLANFRAFVVLSRLADDLLSLAPVEFDRSGVLVRVSGVSRAMHESELLAASEVAKSIRRLSEGMT